MAKSWPSSVSCLWVVMVQLDMVSPPHFQAPELDLDTAPQPAPEAFPQSQAHHQKLAGMNFHHLAMHSARVEVVAHVPVLPVRYRQVFNTLHLVFPCTPELLVSSARDSRSASQRLASGLCSYFDSI